MSSRTSSGARVPASQAGAALVPDSSFVLMESRNGLLTESTPAWAAVLSHVDAFLVEHVN